MYTNAPISPAAPKDFAGYTNALMEQTEILGGLVVSLEERLFAALDQAPPAPSQTTNGASSTPTRPTLGMATDRLQFANSRLRDILQRINL